MNKYAKFLSVFIFLGFLIHTSCKNDDEFLVLVDDIDTQDPDDTIDNDTDSTINDTQVETADYLVLKALYEANPGNALGWNLDDVSMKSWGGVTLSNARVTELRIDQKNIFKLVPEIAKLSELINLFVSDNVIEEVPEEIGDLTKLLWLSLYNNKLEELPVQIGKLTSLEELEFTGNPLTIVPQEICDLALTGTNIKKNEFTMFCSGMLADYQVLKTLYAENPGNDLNWKNNINDPKMTNWEGVNVNIFSSRVDSLFIGQNSLSRIAPEIGNLENLESLTIQENPQINSIPPEIGLLENLTYLSIVEVGFIEIPDQLWNLEKLETINFHNNDINQVSEKLSNLMALKKLILSANNLKTLPEELGRLPISELNLESNPLDSLPQTVCDLSPILDQTQMNNGVCQ